SRRRDPVAAVAAVRRRLPGPGPRRPAGRLGWAEAWKPAATDRGRAAHEPRVVAAGDASGEVVVLWRQRGQSPTGERFECPVLGLYRVLRGRLAYAQMFHF